MSEHQILHLLALYGYPIIALGVAVDSFGLPIPGELMLITASVLAGASHRLSFAVVLAAAISGAIAGDNLSFWLGRSGGSALVRRYGTLFHFGKRRRQLAEYLFARYGGHVVLAGRFIPVIHVWTAFLAGTNAMPWIRFAPANAVGCILWASALGGVGYLFGSTALHVGGLLADISLPVGLALCVAAVIVIRRFEGRLQRAAEQHAAGAKGDAA